MKVVKFKLYVLWENIGIAVTITQHGHDHIAIDRPISIPLYFIAEQRLATRCATQKNKISREFFFIVLKSVTRHAGMKEFLFFIFRIPGTSLV